MDTTTIALIIAVMITITLFAALHKQTRRADRAEAALAGVEAEIKKHFPLDASAPHIEAVNDALGKEGG